MLRKCCSWRKLKKTWDRANREPMSSMVVALSGIGLLTFASGLRAGEEWVLASIGSGRLKIAIAGPRLACGEYAPRSNSSSVRKINDTSDKAPKKEEVQGAGQISRCEPASMLDNWERWISSSPLVVVGDVGSYDQTLS